MGRSTIGRLELIGDVWNGGAGDDGSLSVLPSEAQLFVEISLFIRLSIPMVEAIDSLGGLSVALVCFPGSERGPVRCPGTVSSGGAGVAALECSPFIVEVMIGSGLDAGRGVKIGAGGEIGRGRKENRRSCSFC